MNLTMFVIVYFSKQSLAFMAQSPAGVDLMGAKPQKFSPTFFFFFFQFDPPYS